VGLALGLPMRRPVLAVLPFSVLAAGVLAWRLLLPGGPPPSTETIVTLPIAGVLVALAPLAGRRACAVLALAGATLAMLAYQLQPGYGMPQPFRWNLSVLRGDAVQGIRFACWFGWFAMLVVAAGRAIGGPVLAWAVLPPVLLMVTEWMQTTLPGRTPDLSAPLVGAACAAFAAGLLSARGARRAYERRRGGRAAAPARTRASSG
jgi:hypothetical protein